jgi:hypothetical protein|tara:strand:- start:1107 stop:1241 length:135 start_codon:yes stop_codon:yes gene_type:complete
MPSTSFMIQLETAKELDRLIKSNKGLVSRTDGIKFLLEHYKKTL